MSSIPSSPSRARKKHWSQHFLVDPYWIEKFPTLLPGDARCVWEFGAGDGRITRALLAQALSVVAFEIDPDLTSELQRHFRSEHEARRFFLVDGDMLESLPCAPQAPQALVGNLPFSVASELLRMLSCDLDWTVPSFFIVQEEVAWKMRAREGSKTYTPLSVLVQSAFEIRRVERVAPHSFSPAPRVRAALVSLYPREIPRSRRWKDALAAACRMSFAARRKTIMNNLKRQVASPRQGMAIADIFREAGVALECRAEEVALEQWWRIADGLSRSDSTTSALF